LSTGSVRIQVERRGTLLIGRSEDPPHRNGIRALYEWPTNRSMRSQGHPKRIADLGFWLAPCPGLPSEKGSRFSTSNVRRFDEFPARNRVEMDPLALLAKHEVKCRDHENPSRRLSSAVQFRATIGAKPTLSRSASHKCSDQTGI